MEMRRALIMDLAVDDKLKKRIRIKNPVNRTPRVQAKACAQKIIDNKIFTLQGKELVKEVGIYRSEFCDWEGMEGCQVVSEDAATPKPVVPTKVPADPNAFPAPPTVPVEPKV